MNTAPLQSVLNSQKRAKVDKTKFPASFNLFFWIPPLGSPWSAVAHTSGHFGSGSCAWNSLLTQQCELWAGFSKDKQSHPVPESQKPPDLELLPWPASHRGSTSSSRQRRGPRTNSRKPRRVSLFHSVWFVWGKRHRFNPWVGEIPESKLQQPTPGFSPGESHGQRSLVGYSPWGHRESDMTQHGPSLSQNGMRGVQQVAHRSRGWGEMPMKSSSHHTPWERLAGSQKLPTCLCPITVVGWSPQLRSLGPVTS